MYKRGMSMFNIKKVLATIAIFVARAVIDYLDKKRSKPSA
jgi:hypothetical protein